MKAVQFSKPGDPEVLQVQEVPDPIPGPQDVLIEEQPRSIVLICSNGQAAGQ